MQHGKTAIGVTALVILAGCGASSEHESPFGEVASVSEPILNGTPASSLIGHEPWDQIRKVTVLIKNWAIVRNRPGVIGIGTGTLIRPNVVLTGAHVMSTGGGVSDPMANPVDVCICPAEYVPPDPWNTCDLAQCSRPLAGGIVPAPDIAGPKHQGEDVAAVFIDDFYPGRFAAIERRNPLIHVDASYSMAIAGYGVSILDDGATAGTLRVGSSPVAGTYGNNDFPSLEACKQPRVGTVANHGDSGSGLFAKNTLGTWHSPLITSGVLSSAWDSESDVSWPGNCPSIPAAGYVNPKDYRLWVRQEIAQRAPNRLWDFGSLTFGAAEWTKVAATSPSSGSANWALSGQILGEHYLLQSTNAGSTIAYEGPKLIRSEVLDIAYIGVRVESYDDDEAGIIFRYVDQQHYCQLAVNQATQRAVFVSRVGDVLTPIGAAVALDGFRWNTGVSLQVYTGETSVNGIVIYDGKAAQVAGEDGNYPIGRAGVYTRFLDDAKFDDFQIYNYYPTSSPDW